MYTLYLDESGDSATSKIRTVNSSGASPYMVLGAALVQADDASDILESLSKIQEKISKDRLRCNELNHYQKRFFARGIADCETKLFAVISHKQTLGTYQAQIGAGTWRYYHKCLQYLLEIFGKFLAQHRIQTTEVKIVVEKSNSFKLSEFQNFIRKCQNNPVYQETNFLKNIDVNNILEKPKNDQPLLQLADLVAHSLFQCVNERAGNYGIKETAYLNDIRSKFHCAEDNIICGHGIKPMHNLTSLNLDHEVADFLTNLRPK